MVGELSDIEKVGDQLAHHLTGIVLIIIGKGELFIMVKKLLAHIPFHVRAHHVSLIADVVFTQALQEIHEKKADGDGQKRV